MNGLVILIIAGVTLLGAYLIYGHWLARKWGIDPRKKTPAHEFEDGVDYVPTPPSIVFGHEFASIAGAGPINGPIIAAMFGWLPVLLWILIGGIFFGAVQDFSALYASVKNKGKTIGFIIETYIGKTGKRLFLLFVWLFSILVVAAFADIVAGTFEGFDARGNPVAANASVASTSMLFIFAAVGLGLFLKKMKPKGIVSALVAMAALVLCISLGLAFPVYIAKNIWLYIVFAYIFIASITPVWILLQPRDYLNSFLLIIMILVAFLGVIFSAPSVNLPAFNGFEVNGNYLFPVLFVTVACGAVSGFHALVASGTASKQIDNERHILPISFGTMLVESLLGVISLIAVGSLAVGGKLPSGTPPVIFATAVSGFLLHFGFPRDTVYTIITLAISAFALTSLDSVARVGRLAIQELFTETLEQGREDAVATLRQAGVTEELFPEILDQEETSGLIHLLSNKFIATLLTLFFGYLLAILGYQTIWPLFGSANQLLAALSLIACAVFLKKTKRQGFMLYIPMFCMLGITLTALVFTILNKGSKLFDGTFSITTDSLQFIFAILLFALGIMVAVSGIVQLRKKEAA